MKTSIMQKMYAYITLNPGCTTTQVSEYVNRPSKYVSMWLGRAESKGQVRIVRHGVGRTPNTWVVTNRPVKFNTGETVRAKKPTVGEIRMSRKELENMIAMLSAKLEA